MSLLLVVLATACAGKGGSWPSLARRPIEAATPNVIAGSAAAPAASAALADDAPGEMPRPSTADVPAQLATIERDRVDLVARVEAQVAVTRAAVMARGPRIDGDAWSRAQLEVTRLERLGNQASDLRDRLDVIAGRLAEAGAAGADIAAPLTTTGQIIQRVQALAGTIARESAAGAKP